MPTIHSLTVNQTKLWTVLRILGKSFVEIASRTLLTRFVFLLSCFCCCLFAIDYFLFHSFIMSSFHSVDFSCLQIQRFIDVHPCSLRCENHRCATLSAIISLTRKRWKNSRKRLMMNIEWTCKPIFKGVFVIPYPDHGIHALFLQLLLQDFG